MKLPRPGRRDAAASASAPGVLRAVVVYTALRFGCFAFAFLVAAAIIIPSTTGAAGPRILICAVIAILASVPLSLVLGRRRRDDLTAALLAQRLVREDQDREYDARVRAARRSSASAHPEGAGTDRRGQDH